MLAFFFSEIDFERNFATFLREKMTKKLLSTFSENLEFRQKIHNLQWTKVFQQGQNLFRVYFEAYCNRASTLRIRRLRFFEMNSGTIKAVELIFISEVLQIWNKVIKVISSKSDFSKIRTPMISRRENFLPNLATFKFN